MAKDDDRDINFFLDMQDAAPVDDEMEEDEPVEKKTTMIIKIGNNKAMWVPFIFLIVYFILVGMLWANKEWYRSMKFKMSPAAISMIWLLVFAGIVATWVKCLQNATTKKAVGWISFWFMLNLILLLVAGWAFFVSKNIALANFVIGLLWITSIALIAVAAKHWPVGVIFMVIYFGIISWMWFVVARYGLTVVQSKASKFVGVLMSKDGKKGLLGGFTDLFTMKPEGGAPRATEKTVAGEPKQAPAEPRAARQAMEDALASDTFQTPRGIWRDRGIDE